MTAVRPRSPLTGSDRTKYLDTIDTAVLAEIYRREGLDILSDMADTPFIEVWQCMDSGLKFTVPCVFGSPNFYANIEKNGLEYSIAKYEYEFAAPFVKAGDRVLDVGCGFAHFAAHIPQADFTGLEFSTHAAEIGRAAGRNIISESVEAHAARVKTRYDVVVSFQVIEHVCDPKSFLEACIACTRPGGRLFIGVPADDAFPGIAVNGIYNLPPHHVTLWPDRALKFALEAGGISNVTLSHEPLAEEHRRYFAEQLVLHAFSRPGSPHRYVRRDLSFRIQNKVARAAGRFLQRAFDDQKQLVRGHTVVGTGIKAER